MPVNNPGRFICSRFAGAALLLLAAHFAWAFAGGSLSGIITDPSGAIIPGAKVSVVNTALKAVFHATSDGRGYYSFPALPVGRYDLTVSVEDFQTWRKTVLVDADAALKADAELSMGIRTDKVAVNSSAAGVDTVVETAATHLGEVVQSEQIEALPLNGRAYTDLLAIQPGVTPVTTLTFRPSMCLIMPSFMVRLRWMERSMIPTSGGLSVRPRHGWFS